VCAMPTIDHESETGRSKECSKTEESLISSLTEEGDLEREEQKQQRLRRFRSR
jgi:hypothetical protein